MFIQQLSDIGLNLQHAFLVADLPQKMREQLAASCDSLDDYQQLLLFGHGGTRFWHSLSKARLDAKDPVDAFTVEQVKTWITNTYPDSTYDIIYPGEYPIGLQQLGEFAGWHFPSPFRVGINDHWGTWFAYRAVVLLDRVVTDVSDKSTSDKSNYQSPCGKCATKPCIEHCPAGAVAVTGFDADACMQYRKSAESACKHTCLARVACPVGAEHRYTDEQLRYHYTCSLQTILEHY